MMNRMWRNGCGGERRLWRKDLVLSYLERGYAEPFLLPQAGSKRNLSFSVSPSRANLLLSIAGYRRSRTVSERISSSKDSRSQCRELEDVATFRNDAIAQRGSSLVPKNGLGSLTHIASTTQNYEEIVIPAPKAVPFRFNESLVPIKDMNPWGKRTFHVSLNLLTYLSSSCR